MTGIIQAFLLFFPLSHRARPSVVSKATIRSHAQFQAEIARCDESIVQYRVAADKLKRLLSQVIGM